MRCNLPLVFHTFRPESVKYNHAISRIGANFSKEFKRQFMSYSRRENAVLINVSRSRSSLFPSLDF